MDKLELYGANETLQEHTNIYLRHNIPAEKFVGLNSFYAEDYNSHFVPFHGDLFTLATVHELVGAAGVNMFLELGTYLGGSSLYMGQTLGLEVHTCEPHKVHYETASHLLESFGAVYNETGVEFLKREVGANGAKPLIFVDSHGYGFKWELLDELRAIFATYRRGFVLIDNFKIEGRPEFGWDTGEESGQECSLDYIGNVLREAGVKHVYLSDYNVKTSSAHGLRGACLIALETDWEPDAKLGWKKQTL